MVIIIPWYILNRVFEFCVILSVTPQAFVYADLQKANRWEVHWIISKENFSSLSHSHDYIIANWDKLSRLFLDLFNTYLLWFINGRHTYYTKYVPRSQGFGYSPSFLLRPTGTILAFSESFLHCWFTLESWNSSCFLQESCQGTWHVLAQSLQRAECVPLVRSGEY